MKIKNYDYKYLFILFLAVIIIGNGCGIFGGVRLYEGASGAHTHGGDKKEGNTSKKKDKKGSSSPLGVGVPKSKKHKKWEQEVLFTEAKRDRRKLLAKRVQAKKDAAEREKEIAEKKAEMDEQKAKLKEKQDEQKAEWEAQAENRDAIGLDF